MRRTTSNFAKKLRPLIKEINIKRISTNDKELAEELLALSQELATTLVKFMA